MTEEIYETECGATKEWLAEKVLPGLWDVYTKEGVEGLWKACLRHDARGLEYCDPVHDVTFDAFLLGPSKDEYMIIVPVIKLPDRRIKTLLEDRREYLEYLKREELPSLWMTQAEQEAAEVRWKEAVTGILAEERKLQKALEQKDGVREVLRYISRLKREARRKWDRAHISFTSRRMQLELDLPRIDDYFDYETKKTLRVSCLEGDFRSSDVERQLEVLCRAGAVEKRFGRINLFVARCARDVAQIMQEKQTTMDVLFWLVRRELDFLAAPERGVTRYSPKELRKLNSEQDRGKREDLYAEMEACKRRVLSTWREKNVVEWEDGAHEDTVGGSDKTDLSIRMKAWELGDLAYTIEALIKAGQYGRVDDKRARSGFIRDAVKGVLELLTRYHVKYGTVFAEAERVLGNPLLEGEETEVFARSDAARIVAEDDKGTRQDILTDLVVTRKEQLRGEQLRRLLKQAGNF